MVDILTIQRFMSKVIQSRNCWEWTGAKNWVGYGQFRFNKKFGLAHRFSYELFKEEIPDNLEIDHLCRNRLCVNPDHLEAVTHKINMNRGNGGKACWKFQKSKTHCPHGHEYTKENTRIYKNKRFCRKCSVIKSRNFKLKN